VEPNNLNRQFLHHEKDIGKEKIKSAEEKLLSLNPEIKVETIRKKLPMIMQAQSFLPAA
jgi:adenylyltransferase/sulfurtransferase